LISTSSDISEFIATQTAMVEILRTVEALCLPDCWVGAGFVRNPIWDALHDFPWSASYTDVDVVYFDAAEIDTERDSQIEARLAISIPSALVGQKPSADALPERRPALRGHGRSRAPLAGNVYGNRRPHPGRADRASRPIWVDDLISLVVQPTPAFANKIEVYRARVARKAWQVRWPKLRTYRLLD
jgi:uncharacterized protein